MKFILAKFSCIVTIVGPCELPFAVLQTFKVAALESISVWPSFNPKAVLLVLFPFTNIFPTINMEVGPRTMSLMIFPVSIVDIAICMNYSSITICFVLSPLSLVHIAICPNQYSSAIFNVSPS